MLFPTQCSSFFGGVGDGVVNISAVGLWESKRDGYESGNSEKLYLRKRGLTGKGGRYFYLRRMSFLATLVCNN